MKLSLWIFLTTLSLSASATPGDLIKIESIFGQPPGLSSMTRFKLCPAATKISKDYGYNAYRVTYRTLDTWGNEVQTRGLILVPGFSRGEPRPLLVYQHGTAFARGELPSSFNQFKLNEITAIANCYASTGYITLLADYLGFGDGTGQHPYLHADSEAWVARDLMRASRSALYSIGARTNSNLFVTGYSQGGHAAMSLLRLLATTGEFQVTAGAPMAGPYDLATTAPLVLQNPSKHSTAEIAYILTGLNPLYGFYGNILEAIRPEYAASVISLFDGTKGWDDVVDTLHMRPEELLQPEFVQSSLQNPNSQFLAAMNLNKVYQWHPTSPIRLFHAAGDKDVPFENSQRAYEYFRSVGADVQLINLGNNASHFDGAMLGFGESVVWFETFVQN